MSVIYVTTQGAYVKKRAGRVVVCRGEEELASVPESAVDAVVLFGHVQVTTQTVHLLLSQGTPLVYLSRGGSFRGILQPGMPKNPFVRLAQYEASLDAEFACEMARQLVDSKLAAQELVLRKWKRNEWMEDEDVLCGLSDHREDLLRAHDVPSIMGVEAAAARAYFEGLARALPPGFVWNGRNRRPPRDPVNALLSLSYMLLVGQAVSACHAAGLDPFIGFLHALDYGRPSLALDLIEPLRAPYADHLVIRLLQGDHFTPDDFTLSEEEGCRLNPESFRVFIDHFDAFASGRGNEEPLRNRLQALARMVSGAVRERRPAAWDKDSSADDPEAHDGMARGI